MKAVICTKYGSPEVLKLQEVPVPNPKDNEVLIKVCATAVTASDVLMRGLNAPFIYRFLIQLMMGFGKPRNPIMGMVLSGVVEQIGKDVKEFEVGDEVFASGSMSSFKLKFGAYAEYMCLPENWNLTTKPSNITFQEAAAFPYGAGLSWFYFKKMKIQSGDEILIYGASGSVGLMAIQFAKNSGAIVTAVCSGKNTEMVKSIGADKVIDYTLTDSVSQLEKYHFVFDAVGKTKTSVLKVRAKACLRSDGKYISVDDSTPSTSKEDFVKIRKFIEQGKLKSTIDSVYTLEQIVEAHKYVEKGKKRGSVVISVSE